MLRLVLITVAMPAILVSDGCGADAVRSPGGDGPGTDLITSPQRADAGAALTRGKEILLQSRSAYGLLEAYTGTIVLHGTAVYARGPFTETRKLEVSFQRPGRIRINGYDSNGNGYAITVDGRVTTVSSKSLGIAGTRRSCQGALVEFGGVSLGATTLLPGILLDAKWERENIFLPRGDLLTAFSTRAELKGTDSVDRHECYRVVCSRAIATWTFYVDTKSLLIRRVDEQASEEQFRVQREAGGGGYSGLILSESTLQSWTRTEE